jgi:hypothetical protein
MMDLIVPFPRLLVPCSRRPHARFRTVYHARFHHLVWLVSHPYQYLLEIAVAAYSFAPNSRPCLV